jgi:Uma2 family endonuclease
LVDGTLVEKLYGVRKSVVGIAVGCAIGNWNDSVGRRGIVTGAGGPFRLAKNLIRIPDAAFTSRARLPGGKVPDKPVPDISPELAVEVLSEGNTPAEMERKLKEYFLSEVEVVWFIDPRKRTVRVYTSPDDVTELGEGDTLDGREVLPGFSVPVARLFADLGGPAKPADKTKPKGNKKR